MRWMSPLPRGRRPAADPVSPPSGWRWATRTCTYARRAVGAWGLESADVKGGRHPALFTRTIRLLAMRRCGCLTQTDYTESKALI